MFVLTQPCGNAILSVGSKKISLCHVYVLPFNLLNNYLSIQWAKESSICDLEKKLVLIELFKKIFLSFLFEVYFHFGYLFMSKGRVVGFCQCVLGFSSDIQN
jgi:hypothetical protein